MDERIRKLERLAANGDETALYELQQYWKRSKMVPSDADMDLMRCGYVTGYEPAIPIALMLWQKTLYSVYQAAAAPEADEYGYLIPSPPNEYDQLLDNIRGLEMLPAATPEKRLDQLYQSLNTINYWLDPYLEGYLEGPGIYLHRNDVTGSLRISYIQYREGEDPFKLDTTFRELRNHPSEQFSVDIRWAYPEDFANPRDTMLSILQEHPVWVEWGYGTCDYRTYGIGDYYEPLKDWQRL